MNTPTSATTHAVVWMDHHRATILQIDTDTVPPRHVHAHVHATGQHGSEVRSEHEFFAEVCGILDSLGTVLVTGGKTSLLDLRHYVEKHRPQTAARIAAYEIVDHPTDKQLASLGRQFFEL